MHAFPEATDHTIDSGTGTGSDSSNNTHQTHGYTHHSHHNHGQNYGQSYGFGTGNMWSSLLHRREKLSEKEGDSGREGGKGDRNGSPSFLSRTMGGDVDIGEGQGLGLGSGPNYANTTNSHIPVIPPSTTIATVSIVSSADLEAMGLLKYLQVPPISPIRSTQGKSPPTSRYHNYNDGSGGGGGGRDGGGVMVSPVQSLYATSSVVVVTIRDRANRSHNNGGTTESPCFPPSLLAPHPL